MKIGLTWVIFVDLWVERVLPEKREKKLQH